MKNASDEFEIGKNRIGWMNTRFKEMCKGEQLNIVAIPTSQKLTRDMSDKEIEKDLKPGFSSLSDIYSFVKNASQECKDSNFNLFYFPECVVFVGWDDGGWFVGTWDRDGGGAWDAGCRVFSPATGSQTLEPRALDLSDTLPEQRVVNGITYKRV